MNPMDLFKRIIPSLHKIIQGSDQNIRFNLIDEIEFFGFSGGSESLHGHGSFRPRREPSLINRGGIC